MWAKYIHVHTYIGTSCLQDAQFPEVNDLICALKFSLFIRKIIKIYNDCTQPYNDNHHYRKIKPVKPVMIKRNTFKI